MSISNFVSITPSIIDIGNQSQYEGEIVISNQSDAAIEFKSSLVQIERSETSFAKTPLAGIAALEGIPELIAIPPKENFKINYSFDKSKLSSPDQFQEIGIVFRTANQSTTSGTGTNLDTELITSLLVNGESSISVSDPPSLQIVPEINLNSPINFTSNVYLTTKIINNSQSYIRPQGVITFAPSFGLGNKKEVNFNVSEQRILPGDEVFEDFEITGLRAIGAMDVTLSFVDGNSNVTQTASTTLVYLPWFTVLLITIVLIALVGLLFSAWQWLRK